MFVFKKKKKKTSNNCSPSFSKNLSLHVFLIAVPFVFLKESDS